MTHSRPGDFDHLSHKVIGGTWQMLYGELLSGGDMALYSTDGEGVWQRIATFQRHNDPDLSDEDNTASVATAELLLRAPKMLALLRRWTQSDDPEELKSNQADTIALLAELAAEWRHS